MTHSLLKPMSQLILLCFNTPPAILWNTHGLFNKFTSCPSLKWYLALQWKEYNPSCCLSWLQGMYPHFLVQQGQFLLHSPKPLSTYFHSTLLSTKTTNKKNKHLSSPQIPAPSETYKNQWTPISVTLTFMSLSSLGLLDIPLYSPGTLAVGPFFHSIPNLNRHSGWSQQVYGQLIQHLDLEFPWPLPQSPISSVSHWNILEPLICSTSKTTTWDIPP